MNEDLITLMNTLNKSLFQVDLLEYRYVLGETDRLAIKKEYNNKKFRDLHHFDDLYDIGLNNALFTGIAKSFINEIADGLGVRVKFMYSQCIILENK